MNDFEVNIKCKQCGSTKITVKAIEKYEGDIILGFSCNDCDTCETWGVLDETEES